MNTSISLLGPSRSKRMVEAGRGTTASADMIKLLLMNSSWFETAQARLLTMRDLILRSGLLTASRRMTNSLTRRAGLRLQVRAPVDPRHPRQQIIHLGPRRRGEARSRLALCAGRAGAALHLEIEKQPAIAGQDRQRPQRALLLEGAKCRDLFQPRPVLMLQHHAGWAVHH